MPIAVDSVEREIEWRDVARKNSIQIIHPLSAAAIPWRHEGDKVHSWIPTLFF